MKFNVKLSDNLILISTENHEETAGGVASVAFLFSFFWEKCSIIINADDVESELSHITYTNVPDELFLSLKDLLENEHWEVLKECFKKHIDHFENG